MTSVDRRRSWPARFLAALAAAVLVVLAARAPAAGAQAEPGLTCDSPTPAPDDTLVCDAGGLEAGKGFSWTAAFTEGEELTGAGTVDASREAHFDLTVPDAPGDFTVTLESDGTMDPAADYTFTGTVQASEDESGDMTATAEADDTTSTTEDTTTTTSEAGTAGVVAITSESGDSEVAATAADDTGTAPAPAEPAAGQVAAIPAGGVATGVGPPEGSNHGRPVAVASGLITAVGVMLLAHYRGRRSHA